MPTKTVLSSRTKARGRKKHQVLPKMRMRKASIVLAEQILF